MRRKEFDYGLYRLIPGTSSINEPISLRIGTLDDLNVVRFHAKERRSDTGLVFRWSRDVSYVSFQMIGSDVREVTVWMSNGGRPASVAAARVEVSLEDHVLGEATTVDELRPYGFAIPQDVAGKLAAQSEPVRLRLRVPTWNPHAILGVPDTRDLGVVVTRVDVR